MFTDFAQTIKGTEWLAVNHALLLEQVRLRRHHFGSIISIQAHCLISGWGDFNAPAL